MEGLDQHVMCHPVNFVAVAEADAEGVLDRLGGGEGGLEGAVLSAPL